MIYKAPTSIKNQGVDDTTSGAGLGLDIRKSQIGFWIWIQEFVFADPYSVRVLNGDLLSGVTSPQPLYRPS